jgi:protein TonB
LICTLVIPHFLDKQPVQEQRPTFVRLVEPPSVPQVPQSKQTQSYEIDQQPPKEEQPEVQSQRKADFNQSVVKETAPKGEDARDQVKTEQPGQPIIATPQQQKTAQKPLESTQQKKEAITKEKAVKQTSKTDPAILTPTDNQDQTKTATARPPLTLDQLRPSTEALQQIAQGSSGVNRTKERDVAIGDTVNLNLQQSFLASFFRRFHDQIEMVWHYPTEAIRNQEQGTLQLEIIVDKEGNLIDVIPLKSSGSDRLDFEAIQAVYRGAPFGPLSKHYPHEQLKIRAQFSYRLGVVIVR